MKLMYLNCRGVKAKGFVSLIKDLKMMYSISLLILVETQTSGVIADNVIQKLGFDRCTKVDAVGRAGGSQWDNLCDLAADMDKPWCVIGDFDVIGSDQERVGSCSNRPPRGATQFVSVINDCELIDLGFVGPSYTWKRGNLKERLYRALSNMDLRLKFSIASITHLNLLKSDHSPLLMNFTENKGPNHGRQPFRMSAVWFSHPSF
ncbi:PREDICTED: uncharacterized protein LOC109363611 [Lupinus angustifolius]|uniref:uncharacterized protein LOC109363611 n=1 Tax=Lupinus angustifolius TaxID=3871 RepID=UPI00092E6191|nr:PREDICTED: uncharacterized protein LOC109363611 [Lupinus angustifolius]